MRKMFFNNCQIQIYEPVKTGGHDKYTGAKEEKYVLKTTVPANFQNNSNSDTEVEQGKKLEDTYKVYVNINTPVTDRSILRKVGEQQTYKIEGSPQKFTNLIPHIKLNIKLHRVKVF